ncbi:F-box domain-containing protein [Mycena chlorophos]|uniref:F-box domain-containing protein n=1 Tax=Mycena chlorophos TaxID=658473 RepID=A0A8H6SBV5_MYCCL|nr:F-box domain-containing protein [Mycena chlorophos]
MRCVLVIVATSLALVQEAFGQCADPSLAVPLYRAWNPTATDHFYTTSAQEVANATGYNDEGIRAYLYPTQVANTTEFYRLYAKSIVDHFYTTSRTSVSSAESEGYVEENNTPMFIYPSQICGSVPFYRMYSSTLDDHFYTVDPAEMNAALNESYTFEEVAGYVTNTTSVKSIPTQSTTQSSVPSTSSSQSDTALIAGVTAAAIALALVVVVLLFVLRRHKHATRQPRVLLDDVDEDKPQRVSVNSSAWELTPFRDARGVDTRSYTDVSSMSSANLVPPTTPFGAQSTWSQTSSLRTLSVVNYDPDQPPEKPLVLSKAAQMRQEQLRNQLEAVQAQLGALGRGDLEDREQSQAGPSTKLEEQNVALRLRVQELEAQMESKWANGLSDEPPPGYME